MWECVEVCGENVDSLCSAYFTHVLSVGPIFHATVQMLAHSFRFAWNSSQHNIHRAAAAVAAVPLPMLSMLPLTQNYLIMLFEISTHTIKKVKVNLKFIDNSNGALFN